MCMLVIGLLFVSKLIVLQGAIPEDVLGIMVLTKLATCSAGLVEAVSTCVKASTPRLQTDGQ